MTSMGPLTSSPEAGSWYSLPFFHVMVVPPPVLRFSRDNESYDHYLFLSVL